jgi:uncharacterized protein YndB with AHSA1/START domain
VTGSRVLVALRVGAPPQRTFDAFTGEIGQWWRPDTLFRFTDRSGGRLAFEPEPPERLVEIGADGERFEVVDTGTLVAEWWQVLLRSLRAHVAG